MDRPCGISTKNARRDCCTAARDGTGHWSRVFKRARRPLALLGVKSEFVRKRRNTALKTSDATWKAEIPAQTRAVAAARTGFRVLFSARDFYSARLHIAGTIPFLLLFFFGFGYMGVMSLLQTASGKRLSALWRPLKPQIRPENFLTPCFRQKRITKKEGNHVHNPLCARPCACLSMCFLSISISAFAQSQANTGNIEGRVTDPNSASVPNVTVTATNLATGLSKNAVTNDEGIYRIVFLPPGAYKVETSGAQGFVPATFTNVVVTVGGQTPLDIQMAVGNAAVAMVDVSAEGQVWSKRRALRSLRSSTNARFKTCRSMVETFSTSRRSRRAWSAIQRGKEIWRSVDKRER